MAKRDVQAKLNKLKGIRSNNTKQQILDYVRNVVKEAEEELDNLDIDFDKDTVGIQLPKWLFWIWAALTMAGAISIFTLFT